MTAYENATTEASAMSIDSALKLPDSLDNGRILTRLPHHYRQDAADAIAESSIGVASLVNLAATASGGNGHEQRREYSLDLLHGQTSADSASVNLE